MTDEQNKIVLRCKLMLKTAFPDLSGKLIFNLNKSLSGALSVKCDVVHYNVGENCKDKATA